LSITYEEATKSGPILASKLIIIKKNGEKTDYTHVTEIRAKNNVLIIKGETNDVDKTRINVVNYFNIKELHIGIIEFYKPPE
jgi:hypothetical protein